MKKFILLLAIAIAFCPIANAQTPVKKIRKSQPSQPQQPPLQSVGAKLLLKCNVNATVLINDKDAVTIEANKLVTLTMPAGRSMVSIVPTEANTYSKLDTILAIARGDQDVFSYNFNKKVLSGKDIVSKSLDAIGLNKSYNSIKYDVQEPYQVRKSLFVFPDKSSMKENYIATDGISNELCNERIIYKNTIYSRGNYFFYLEGTQSGHLTDFRGGAVAERPWDARSFESDTNSFINLILQDMFIQSSFFDYNNNEHRYQNLGEEIIEGRTFVKVQLKLSAAWENNTGSTNFGFLAYFDKETFLPLKLVYHEQYSDGSQELQLEYEYSNFKYNAPFMFPSKITITPITNTMKFCDEKCCGVYTINNVEINYPTNNETSINRPSNIK